MKNRDRKNVKRLAERMRREMKPRIRGEMFTNPDGIEARNLLLHSLSRLSPAEAYCYALYSAAIMIVGSDNTEMAVGRVMAHMMMGEVIVELEDQGKNVTKN